MHGTVSGYIFCSINPFVYILSLNIVLIIKAFSNANSSTFVFILRSVLVSLDLLSFLTFFGNNFWNHTHKHTHACIWDLDWDHIEFINQFGRIYTFVILSLPIYEQCIFFYLFNSTFIFLNKVLEFPCRSLAYIW